MFWVVCVSVCVCVYKCTLMSMLARVYTCKCVRTACQGRRATSMFFGCCPLYWSERFIFLLCVCVFYCMYVWALCLYSARGSQKKILGPLKLVVDSHEQPTKLGSSTRVWMSHLSSLPFICEPGCLVGLKLVR